MENEQGSNLNQDPSSPSSTLIIIGRQTNFQAALQRPFATVIVTAAATYAVAELTPVVTKVISSVYCEIKSWFKTDEKKEE